MPMPMGASSNHWPNRERLVPLWTPALETGSFTKHNSFTTQGFAGTDGAKPKKGGHYRSAHSGLHIVHVAVCCVLILLRERLLLRKPARSGLVCNDIALAGEWPTPVYFRICRGGVFLSTENTIKSGWAKVSPDQNATNPICNKSTF